MQLSFGMYTKSLSPDQRTISLTMNDAETMSWLGGGVFGNTIVLIPAHASSPGDEYLKVVRGVVEFGEEIKMASEERPCYYEGEDALPFGA